MIERLKEVAVKQKCVSLYMDSEDTSRFVFGRILCVNGDHIAILMISPEGDYDGLLVKRTEAVIRLEMDDKYARKMHKLCNEKNVAEFEGVIDELDIVKSALDYAKTAKKIISCELLNSGSDDIVGFLEDIKNGLCEIKQVDAEGCEDGYSYIMMNDITQISYDSKEEQFLLRLWKQNNA